MESLQKLAAPIGRLLLAAMFVQAGYSKIGGYDGIQGWMESMGVPGALLPLVIVLEIVGGLAIIAGFKTRIVAILLAGFCVLSAMIFHNNLGDQIQFIMFMKNISLAGAFLLLFANGAGAYSFDNRNN